MELIKKKDSKYDEYERLLLERDQVEKEAGSIWVSYIQQFGKQISDIYEEKIECIKCKKLIAYYQTALNHGSAIDPDELKRFMDEQMAAYYQNLKRMLKETDECQKAKSSTAYEVKRSKELYRRLAKLLHPDINPATDREEKLKELWERIVSAYGRNNVKELSELEVLARKALEELGAGKIQVEIPDIEDKIEDLKAEIEDIVHNEPYIHKSLLEDADALRQKAKALDQELEEYRKYHEELEELIENLMQEGGVTIKWELS